MTRKPGETPEEEFEDAARRFIESEEDLSWTATNQDWFDFLSDKLGYDLSKAPRAMDWWSMERLKVQELTSVRVDYIPKIQQTVYRIPKGEPGAGQFMSKETAATRLWLFHNPPK